MTWKNCLTDIDGLQVGCAEDPRAFTGVTVIVPDERSVCAVDVRGGGPGTRESDALAAASLVEAVDALVLAGGSVYGLAAADAVTRAMGAEGRGFGLVPRPGVPLSPVVPAAILYDLANGGDKDWSAAPPYATLGEAAYRAKSANRVALGRAGAGFGARAGALRGGQGCASVRSAAGFSVAALTAVNSFGSVQMPGGAAFWAWPFEIAGEFGGARPSPDWRLADPEDWGAAKTNPSPRENTTIAVIATDAALTRPQAQRVAMMASAGFARAIRPVFAPFDGDVVFVLSTGKHALPEPAALSIARLGELAANCLARAIARGVWEANRPA